MAGVGEEVRDGQVIAKPTSWPCPVAFDDSTSVHALADALGDPDAAIYALRLWHHRRRCGEVVDVGDPSGTIEKACHWRRKKGVLVDALASCGFVVRLPEGPIVIRPWEEVAKVDWTRSGGEAPVKPLTPEQQLKQAERRAADTKRKSIVRAADKVRTVADDDRPQDVRGVSAADKVVDLVANVPESLEIPLAGTRATGTCTLTGTTTSEDQVPVGPAAPTTDGLFAEPTSKTPRKQKPVLVPTADVAIVWNAYAAHHPTSKFTPDRQRVVLKALAVGYSAADLVRTIEGYAVSPFHNGDNPDKRKHLDIEIFLRDAKHIEAGWEHLASDTPSAPEPVRPSSRLLPRAEP